MSSWNILIVSSDQDERLNLSRVLVQHGCEAICACNIREGLESLEKQAVDLIFCDSEFVDGSYREFLNGVRALKNKTRVVVTSRLADWDEYLVAMRLGAFDMIALPCRPTDIQWLLIQASREERNRLRSSGVPLPELTPGSIHPNVSAD
jgi:DNA-binding NtrC family response regulator